MPDPTKAIDALTGAMQTLAHSPALSRPAHDAFWPTMGLLLANLILAIAAVWSAVLARRATQAAKQSAEQAEKLVNLERRRAMLASVPRLVLSSPGWDLHGLSFQVSNRTGTGTARLLGIYLSCERGVDPEHYEPRYPFEIAQEKNYVCKVPMSQPGNWRRLVILCHYTDLHSTAQEPRIYHSIFVDTHGAVGPSGDDYFPPERPMLDNPEFREFVGLCKVCGG